VLLYVLHILPNASSSSTHMGGTFVECVKCIVCSISVLVRCFLCQPLILCCRTSPKYEKESENLLPCSLLTFYVFVQLSQLVAMCHLLFCIVTKVPGRCPHIFSPKEEPLAQAPTLWNCNTPWIWQLNHVCSTFQPLLSP
jgi:hypothetical protein